ncbi:hypothetical protein Q7P37_011321 [Cladosporium fusiforme]
MPLFSRLRSKGATPAKEKSQAEVESFLPPPTLPKYQSTWTSTEIVPEEVEELIHYATAHMKSRAEALDSPFLLLPFRLDADPTPARSFVSKFFTSNASGSQQYRGDSLQQELRLTEPQVLCSVLKWCWSRLPGGVVTWPIYEAFRIGEQESRQARHAFDTFVPIAADSAARNNIIVDFFELLAAVAAHGKRNGMGGRKVSRLAGWWAFDHSDNGKGFEGGYKSWTAAADATSHLFFAYLRTLSPEADPSLSVIERIPRSLQALLAQTEYPPETPTMLQRSTPRVLMLVDTVSPGPFALLRRAKHFEYQSDNRVLLEFSEYDDPTEALTDECKRVLYAIATTNSSGAVDSRQAKIQNPEESWSAFSNMGFSDLGSESAGVSNGMNGSANPREGLQSGPRSRHTNNARPTTPSWADFLNSGFEDNGSPQQQPTLFVPRGELLPPISRAQTPATRNGDDNLAPGELAAITNVELDDAFWWVWMTSLSGEEPNERKAVFGRCALIETSIMQGKWLIMEEQVQGASPEPMEGVQLVEKKSRFGFTKRGRGKKSVKEMPTSPPLPDLERAKSATPSKHSIAPGQHAKIKAAAAALAQKQNGQQESPARRGRGAADAASKTNSAMTLGLQNAAGPAMKWANSYDKKAVRAQYLGEDFASKDDLTRQTSYMSRVSTTKSAHGHPPALSPESSTFPKDNKTDRDLPALPQEERPATVPGVVQKTEPAPLPPKTQESTVVPVEAKKDKEAAEKTPIPEPVVRESTDQKSVASPAPSAKVERKPLPQQGNLEIHPAFRQKSVDEPARASPSPNRGPAVLAAQKALESKVNSGPQSNKDHNVLRKQPPSGGAFKKMFGRNKANRNSVDVQSPPASLSPPSESSLTRRLSHMRNKKPSTPPTTTEPVPNVPAQASADVEAPVAESSDVPEPTLQEPTVPEMFAPQKAAAEYPKEQFAVQNSAVPAPSEGPVSPLSPAKTDSSEARNATAEFSRFDQGPMDDMPAAMPCDSIDDDANDAPDSPVKSEFDTRSERHQNTERDQPTPSERFATPLERNDPNNDAVSAISEEGEQGAYAPQQVQDRWAQIRENAARRAARASEEQSRPSQSARTDDDGATSEEETIESRVARIKARVAELTGNVDDGSAPPRRY